MPDLDQLMRDRIASDGQAPIPPWEAVAAVARRRRRSVRTRTAGLAVAGAAAVLAAIGMQAGPTDPDVLPAANGTVRGGGGDAGLGPAITTALVPLRPLPDSALLQMTVTGGNAGPEQPSVPEIALRLYDDGTLLTSTGRTIQDRWQQQQLSDPDLARARKLIADAGLAAERSRDYGRPTNTGFTGSGRVYQVDGQSGETTTLIEYGGTVNDVPSSDAGLSQAQRDARATVDELTALLEAPADQSSTTYVPRQWSRYAKTNLATADIDRTASPEWSGRAALDSGQVTADGLRCTAVSDPAADSGRRYANGQYRVGETAWVVRYVAVLPDEPPCTATGG